MISTWLGASCTAQSERLGLDFRSLKTAISQQNEACTAYTIGYANAQCLKIANVRDLMELLRPIQRSTHEVNHNYSTSVELNRNLRGKFYVRQVQKILRLWSSR